MPEPMTIAGGRAGAITESMLCGSAEGCEVIQIENVEPGADVFPFRIGSFLVAVETFPLIDRCRSSAVHEFGPGFDLLSATMVLLIFFDPVEDFAVSQTLGDLFL